MLCRITCLVRRHIRHLNIVKKKSEDNVQASEPTCRAMWGNMQVTQLLKADRSKGCLYLNTVCQCYLKWVLRLKCETRKACRLSSPSKEARIESVCITVGARKHLHWLTGIAVFAPVRPLNGWEHKDWVESNRLSTRIESTLMMSRNDFNLYRIDLYRNNFVSKRPSWDTFPTTQTTNQKWNLSWATTIASGVDSLPEKENKVFNAIVVTNEIIGRVTRVSVK